MFNNNSLRFQEQLNKQSFELTFRVETGNLLKNFQTPISQSSRNKRYFPWCDCRQSDKILFKLP